MKKIIILIIIGFVFLYFNQGCLGSSKNIIDLNTADIDGNSALVLAVNDDNTNISTELIKKGAKVNVKDDDAIKRREEKIAEYLISKAPEKELEEKPKTEENNE